MTKRTQRRRSHDRLLAPDGHEHPGMIRCDLIVAPLDRFLVEMDRKWGTDRLAEMLPHDPPPHVPADKADEYRLILPRYAEATEELNRALAANDVEATRTWTGRALKMAQVIDAQCDAAGVARPAVECWAGEFDGKRIALVRDNRDVAAAEAMHPGAEVWTMGDALEAIARRRDGLALMGAAKAAFPGAKIHDVRSGDQRERRELNDPIPFP